jgi:hypothetical protein
MAWWVGIKRAPDGDSFTWDERDPEDVDDYYRRWLGDEFLGPFATWDAALDAGLDAIER